MAITSSPRLGITRWSDPADPFTRAQMEADHAALDNLAAVDVQGLLASRPAAGVRGRWYATTDTLKQLFREDGTTWHEVALVGDGKTVSLGTTTGTKIGGATTQKLGFFNATPVAQQANSVDLGVVLSNLGLRAAGGSYTLDPGATGVIKAGASVQAAAAFLGPYGYGFSSGNCVRILGGTNYVRLDGFGADAAIDLVLMPGGTGKFNVTNSPTTAGVIQAFPNAGTLGFYSQTPVTRQAVTGSRGGNAALASLITALATVGIISDSSTA